MPQSSVQLACDEAVDRWPCFSCGSPGVRNLGTRGYCAGHLSTLYLTFDPTAFGFAGIGVQAGPLRSDYGAGWAELRCVACSAEWVGVLFDPCPWCQHSSDLLLEQQRRLLLYPDWLESVRQGPRYDDLDDVGRAIWDATRGQPRGHGSLAAWLVRLARAVDVGLITQPEADAAADRYDRSRP
jgi:hypothetical protein